MGPVVFSDWSFRTADLQLHYRNAYQFTLSFLDGNFYPRWAHLDHRGLGLPTFLFYYPGFYYVTTLFVTITGNLWLSMKLALLVALTLMTLVAGLGFKLWKVPTQWKACATFMTVASPLVALLIHHFSAWPWIFSFPFILLSIFLSIRSNSLHIALGLAIAFACLCYSHLLSALMFVCCFGIGNVWHIVVSSEKMSEVKSLALWLGAVVVGFMIAAPYVIPALSLNNLIWNKAWFIPKTLDWRNSFIFPFYSWSRFGIRWPLLQFYVPAVLCLQVFAVLMVFVFIRRSGFRGSGNEYESVTDGGVKRAEIVLGAAIVASLALASDVTYPLWNLFVSLQKVQFPFRWLIIASLAAPVAFFALVPAVRGPGLNRCGLVMCVVVFINALATQMIIGQATLQGQKLELGVEDLNVDEFTYYQFVPKTRREGSERYVDQGGFPGECARKDVICEPAEQRPETRSWTLSAEAKTTLALPILFFPGWVLFVDGKTTEPEVDLDTGLIKVVISRGVHHVGLTFGDLWAIRMGEEVGWVGFGLWAVILVGSIFWKLLSRKKRRAVFALPG